MSPCFVVSLHHALDEAVRAGEGLQRAEARLGQGPEDLLVLLPGLYLHEVQTYLKGAQASNEVVTPVL